MKRSSCVLGRHDQEYVTTCQTIQPPFETALLRAICIFTRLTIGGMKFAWSGRGSWCLPNRDTLRRKPHTPSSIGYRPPPLHITLSPIKLTLPTLGKVMALQDLTVFDFGAVSLAVHVPFTADAKSLATAASGLADCPAILNDLRQGVEPLFEKLLPSIDKPLWSDLSKDILVFRILPRRCPTSKRFSIERANGWRPSCGWKPSR